MALQRSLIKGIACHDCQQWLLRSFMFGTGDHNSAIQPTTFGRQSRSFSRTARRLNEARERIQQEEHVLNEINYEYSEHTSRPSPQPAPEKPPQTTYVPWYLQVQQPRLPRKEDPSHPLAARQRLPDVPSQPPTILQPLLNHVSTDLGIDSLALLDLRALDPPPALGANLLMIIGTARSEKHLHVSADRLCRWLRSEYQLRPYADGLLGRNELKLKIRRKAKRTRILSAAGVGAKATGDGEIDDGIRTGWVCVNVGRVEGGELHVDEGERRIEGEEREGFVGFGTRRGGCNVVVQMLTEEKRAELDMERLWMDMLEQNRRESANEKTQDGQIEGEGTAEVMKDDALSRLEHASTQHQHSASTKYLPNMHTSDQNVGQQLRAYHASAR